METCKGIILKTTNYSDTQKIIHVYSLEKGYLSFISPSSIFKRKHRPVHLLQIVEIEYFENAQGSLHKLRSSTAISNLPSLYFDIFKMNILLLWGEILNLLLRNEGKNEALFQFIAHSLEYLNTTKEDTANFNLFFLYRLPALLGYRIDTQSWQEGYVFDINNGSFRASETSTPYISGPNTARIIHRIFTCEVGEIGEIPLNRQARNILLDVILLFFSIHLNIDFNIKSIRVIREIFS